MTHMLRTLISLCALLAALFFVFRGVQESSANGQTIGDTSAARTSTDVYRQLILQRARDMQRRTQADTESAEAPEQAMLRAFAELELGWELLTLLEQDVAINETTRTQPVEPAYQGILTFPEDAGTNEASVAEQTHSPTRRQLTEAEQRLREKIERCLAIYQPKLELSAADHNCWEVMHALIGYGIEKPGARRSAAV